ncbi:MAG: bifunctional diaminohydroxyphosphoribosylaminopyrimidine deaminase/5-amino-6-(5-phosphoribosylamino)uracil reductase RibD [Candidatus Omnitrophota bacterium]|nr:MAG: bifunctional diaminohydroxyphosphoribosylaminopyrimidine deaminase/5-amino-6-(5-phosphoribosylamino)uracil reductase RibD [Candidatus Omnitrophota bacterium]RKY45259.1 MAG: bifunctional diaminohydroxyphosphoribosylaminopyrimidine deaminase/5-amino-6-(5-phosphoribosylamino)uracil reductase RibD [Candidatus Omnitrophota bacterium]
MPSEIYFIKKTFELAKKGEGYTSPNPLVGAIIVKDNKIVGWGYHKKAGAPHAEIIAINKAGKKVKNSTLYVNLEPCCHWGRTPPCVDRVINAGIRKVVISTCDPNPMVRGKSIRKLRKAGIEVKVGILAKQAKKINEVFFKNVKKNLPFVVVKVAQSLDGKIATRSGDSRWITSPKARMLAKALRDKYDGICVGVNTVISDNPTLEGLRKTPFKIILDPNLDIPLECKVVKRKRFIIFTTPASKRKRKKIDYLARAGQVYFLNTKDGIFNLREVLKVIYERGVCSLFVEGGSFTLGSFFDQRLVDKIYFFLAPKIIGGKEALPSVGGYGAKTLKSAFDIQEIELEKIGRDFLFSGYIS